MKDAFNARPEIEGHIPCPFFLFFEWRLPGVVGEMAMLLQQPAGMASERPPAMPELLESLRNDERGDLTLIA